MSSPPRIRLVEARDLNIVRFKIGTSLMVPLAAANRKAYKHPLTIAAWVALASIMIQFLGWWPSTEGPLGVWGVLTPFPAFAAVAVPIMFFFDWFNRPAFEEALNEALKASDMKNPHTHYSRSPASGFFILEYNDQPIGLIALDASPSASNGASGTTAETALIRHFHVDEMYHPSGEQRHLLEYAISHAFSAKSKPQVQKVRAVSSALDEYKAAALRVAGFHPVARMDEGERREWTVGVYNWECRWVEITREEWEATKR